MCCTTGWQSKPVSYVAKQPCQHKHCSYGTHMRQHALTTHRTIAPGTVSRTTMTAVHAVQSIHCMDDDMKSASSSTLLPSTLASSDDQSTSFRSLDTSLSPSSPSPSPNMTASSTQSTLSASAASPTSLSNGLSRFAFARTPLLSNCAGRLYPFVCYRFLVQARISEVSYQVILAAVAVFTMVRGWPLPLLIQICAVWLCVRALLTLGLHLICPALHKFYQRPPLRVRAARQILRAVSLAVVFPSLVVSSQTVLESTDPTNTMLAIWCLLMCECCLTACAALLYGLLHLVVQHKHLSTLFPFIQPAAFASSSFASSTSTVSPGLAPSELSRLPCCEYKVGMMAALAEDGCVICQCGVSEGEAVRLLRCGHGFHRQCVDEWLQRRSVCPLCVQVVTVDNQPPQHQQQIELTVHQPTQH